LVDTVKNAGTQRIEYQVKEENPVSAIKAGCEQAHAQYRSACHHEQVDNASH
jgi:hypothetical protein